MKITTTYTPTDTNGLVFNLAKSYYTLGDLSQLATDLAAAGVQPTDALRFVVDSNGTLTIVSEK